jgi:hypothetical protein
MFGLETEDEILPTEIPTLSQVQAVMAKKAADGDPLAATAYANLMDAETKRMEWLAWTAARQPAQPAPAPAAASQSEAPLLTTVETSAPAEGLAAGDKSFADRVAESQKSAPNGAALE